MTETQMAKKKKVVRFAPEPEIQLFERQNNPDDARKLWYSRKDFRTMKMRNTMQAVRDFHIRYCSSSFGSSGGDTIFDLELELNGIENLITPHVVKTRQVNRNRYFVEVLEEQDRQEYSGEYDAKRLGRISRHYSKWTTKRAYQIGMGVR